MVFELGVSMASAVNVVNEVCRHMLLQLEPSFESVEASDLLKLLSMQFCCIQRQKL